MDESETMLEETIVSFPKERMTPTRFVMEKLEELFGIGFARIRSRLQHYCFYVDIELLSCFMAIEYKQGKSINDLVLRNYK